MSPSRISCALVALTFAAGCAGANNGTEAFTPQGSISQSRAAAPASPASHRSLRGRSLGTNALTSMFLLNNIYVVSKLNNTVTVYTPGVDNPVRTVRNGLDLPQSLAFDSSGDMFVGNANSVTEYAEAGSAPNVVTGIITAGVNAPSQIAEDQSDNLWVANTGGPGSITEYAPGSTTPRVIAASINDPVDIAFSASDNLVAVANAGSGTVTCYNQTTGKLVRTITAGISTPTAVVFDDAGNLYVANTNNVITVYQAGTIAVDHRITTNISSPSSLVVAGGQLWVANAGNGTVASYDPAGGPPASTNNNQYFANVVALAVNPFGPYIASAGDYLTLIPLASNNNICALGCHPAPTTLFAPTLKGAGGPSAVGIGP